MGWGRHTVSVGMEHSATEPKSEPEKPRRRRGGTTWKFTLLGLISVFVVLAAYDLVSVSGQVGSSGVAPKSSPVAAASTPAGAASSAAPPATAVLTPTPASRSLPVASIATFGPQGPSDGDNPGIVSRINTSGAQPWYSSWYATPEFGNLQAGTGLLLDMGDAVRVSDLRLVLGNALGADIQVRVGNSATLAGLATVAGFTDAGGTVRLPVTSSASGRYVLVWFTRLPPNGQPGQYQVDVYGVTVDGTVSSAP
jgi:hypothetical protein